MTCYYYTYVAGVRTTTDKVTRKNVRIYSEVLLTSSWLSPPLVTILSRTMVSTINNRTKYSKCSHFAARATSPRHISQRLRRKIQLQWLITDQLPYFVIWWAVKPSFKVFAENTMLKLNVGEATCISTWQLRVRAPVCMHMYTCARRSRCLDLAGTRSTGAGTCACRPTTGSTGYMYYI